MGRPKAWLPWNGEPMVLHVVRQLLAVVDEVVVVTSQALDLPPLPEGARTVRDSEPERGPLAGLRDGLSAISAPWAFVTSTDAPHLTADYVEALFAFGEPAAPEVDGFVQVLSAVYPKRGAGVADDLVASDKLRPLFLLESLGYRAVRPDELPSTAPLRGFNTPDQYLDAAREAFPGATATIELLGRARQLAGVKELSLPIGRLGDLLTAVGAELGLVEDGALAPGFLVSLEGRDVIRDLAVPVGPGERVIVIDAAAGG